MPKLALAKSTRTFHAFYAIISSETKFFYLKLVFPLPPCYIQSCFQTVQRLSGIPLLL